MQALVEQPDHTYKTEELPIPEGCFYCDHCGDCLRCSHDDFCWDGELPMWVIYLNDKLNPHSR